VLIKKWCSELSGGTTSYLAKVLIATKNLQGNQFSHETAFSIVESSQKKGSPGA
jgi:hypothetical protein